MSTKFYVIAVWTLLSFVVKVNAQDKVECWDRFELSFKQVTKENPFDIRLSATFVCGKEKKIALCEIESNISGNETSECEKIDRGGIGWFCGIG